jgi:thiamine-phosphate pyrophosphorylase
MAIASQIGRRLPLICYVTDRQALASADPPTDQVNGVLERIRTAAEAGVDWIQIREKDLPARALLQLSRHAVAIGKARVLVNDRLDVALAARAAGVHLGHESAPVGAVVRWCRDGNVPREFLVGVSCHSLEDVGEAQKAGADYIFFGPVFETPSKQRFGAPQGITRLAEVCRASRIPVIAIGGIRERNAVECIRAGAGGIAAIRLFQEAVDAGTLEEIVARLHHAG